MVSFLVLSMALHGAAYGEPDSSPPKTALDAEFDRIREDTKKNPVKPPEITDEDRRAIAEWGKEEPTPDAPPANPPADEPPVAKPIAKKDAVPDSPPKKPICAQNGCKKFCTGDLLKGRLSGQEVPGGWKIAGFATAFPPQGMPPAPYCMSLAGLFGAIDKRINNPGGSSTPKECQNPQRFGRELTVLVPQDPSQARGCKTLLAATADLEKEPCFSLTGDNGKVLTVCMQLVSATSPGPQAGNAGGPTIDPKVNLRGTGKASPSETAQEGSSSGLQGAAPK